MGARAVTNPVLVEVTRGPLVESVHRGAVAVVEADGGAVLAVGDVSQAVFPRSAVKAIQALPLVESGAADAYGFDDADLALACSSHSGEAAHVARATSMLARAGLSTQTLECGGHFSSQGWVARDQAERYGARADVPAVCNNCSGKHSGFVCTAAHLGEDPRGYTLAEHPVQRRVRASLEELTGAAHRSDACGVDGCSIPTYATPLSALALGFARMATGAGLSAERAKAARRLLHACMTQPYFVAGRERFCTRIMEAGPGRIFAKTGAEGVFCGAIPELGLGIALKCDDGASRAAEAMMAAMCAHLLSGDPLADRLEAMARAPLRNWRGVPVGEVRALPLG